MSTSTDVNSDNEKLVAEYWAQGFGGTMEPTGKGWGVRDVDPDVVLDFLGRFKVHRDFGPVKASIMTYLDQIRDRHPVMDVLLISVEAGGEDESTHALGAQQRAVSPKTVVDGGWRLNGYRVASRGDERLMLSEQQVADAVAGAASEEIGKSDKGPSDYHYRIQRKKPLLMVHVLQPRDRPDLPGRIPAFGVSFPDGLYGETVEIVANKVWMDHMYGPMDDNPDDEEDFDG